MKQLATILVEDANSAKDVKLPYKSYVKGAKSAYMLWEMVPHGKMAMQSYYKSFASPEMDKLLGNTEPGYVRGFVINMVPAFLVYSWAGKILHEEIARGLKANAAKLKLPELDYPSLYESTIMGHFQKNWVFPVIYNEGSLRANLTNAILKQFNKEEKIKDLFKLTDQQWKNMLEDAW
jgi:hypothetical protein